MVVRSPLTASPLLVGLLPGATVTVNSVMPPGNTLEGVAAPLQRSFSIHQKRWRLSRQMIHRFSTNEAL